jgi:hypothetical protein
MRITSFMGAMLLSLLMAGTAEKANAGLFVSITVAPPPLVVYSQPALPGPGYMWTPGYWSWDEDAGDYFWVPGAWVLAPEPGLLWTPGYWGWSDEGIYVWHGGYWGPHVGFYGGVSYGYGYGGVGFEGGYWRGGVYSYNRSVMNVGVGVSINVYSKVVVGGGHSQTSFNGGKDGIRAEPSAQERAYANEHHIGATQQQREHHEHAAKDPGQKFGTNHGKPAAAATSKAGDFSSAHTVGAKPAGTGFKPTALKTQGGPVGNQTGAGTGTKHHESVKQGSALNKTGKTGGANFGAANRFHSDNLKSSSPSKGAALQGAKRPGPAPHPAARPVAKAPADKKKH